MYRIIADRIVEGCKVNLPSFVIDQAEDDKHAYAIAGMILGHGCSIVVVKLK